MQSILFETSMILSLFEPALRVVAWTFLDLKDTFNIFFFTLALADSVESSVQSPEALVRSEELWSVRDSEAYS